MSVVTISAINADIGGYVGDSGVHPDLLAEAERGVGDASAPELAIDGSVNSRGDDVNLVMTDRHGVDAGPEHHFAWDTFVELTHVAKRLHLYGAGQDLSLYRIFCDPFNTAGLSIDKSVHAGLMVAVHDLIEHGRAFFKCPEDLYDMLVYIRPTGRSVLEQVFGRGNLDHSVASMSTSRLSLIAGRYVGKDDAVMIVRRQGGLPAVGEVREMADYVRPMGPLEPGRLPMEDVEYATMPQVSEWIDERWEPIEEPTPIPAWW